MNKLVNYYLLCSADSGKVPHVVNELTTEQLSQIISKKEHRDYLRRLDGKLVAAESIIGGDEVAAAADNIAVGAAATINGGSIPAAAAATTKIIVFY